MVNMDSLSLSQTHKSSIKKKKLSWTAPLSHVVSLLSVSCQADFFFPFSFLWSVEHNKEKKATKNIIDRIIYRQKS